MDESPTEETKRKYLDRMGRIQAAQEAVDLEDHREILAINRAKLKQDARLTIDQNGSAKMESYKIDPKADEMRIGDEVHNHYSTQSVPTSAGSDSSRSKFNWPTVALTAGALMGGFGLNQLFQAGGKPGLTNQRLHIEDKSPTLITQPPAFILEGAEVLEKTE